MIFCSIFNPAPTFTDVTISNLSASQAVMTDANKKLVSADYLNQAVKDTSSPTFKIITITDLSAGGLVLSTAGLLSVITNNSANWNTAYGWGNHAGLYLPLAGTAADSDKLDGQHGSYYQVAGSYQPLATNLTSLAGLTFVSTSFVKMTSAGTFGLDTNVYYKSGDSPTFANITDSALSVAGFVKNFATGLLSTEAPGTATYIPYSSGTGFSYSENLTFTNNATATLSELLCAGNLSAGAFLKIPNSTSTVGQIRQNNVCVFHTYYPKNKATTGRNVFIGESAGNFTINNSVNDYDGTQNVGIGKGSLGALTTGLFNMAIGTNSGVAITSGDSNVLIGPGSGLSITIGYGNMFFGRNSGVTLISGYNNCGVGAYSLYSTTGNGNIGIGHNTGYTNGSGSGSIYIGAYAGYRQTASNVLIVDSTVAARADIATEIANAIIYGTNIGTLASQTLQFNAQTTITKTLGVTQTATFTVAPVVSTLTAGRVLFAGASKEIVDDADLTFVTDTLTATKISTGLILPTTGQTTVNGLTGTADWSMPFQGSSYKKFLVYLTNFTSAGSVITFPTSFVKTPFVYGDAAAIAIAVTTTTTTTLTSVGAVAGFIIIEGY